MSRARVGIVIALVVALAAVIAGCGGGDNEETTAAPATTQATTTAATTTAATTTAATTTAATTTAATTTAATTTAAAQGDVAAGKIVFLQTAGCGGCHTLSDAGSTGTVGPNLDQAKPDFATVQQMVINGGGAMPAFGKQGTLNDTQIADVAAYVSSVAGQ